MDDIAAASTGVTPQREIPFEFRATGGEYFRIWIVNLLLSIVTIGIYSAWAKVRRLRYFYGSTSLDGASFEYHGRPIQILKGRLIAFAGYLLLVIPGRFYPLLNLLLFPLIVFGIPWVIMRSRAFQLRMTSWRGLRFKFHGTYGGAMGAYIGWVLLSIVSLGILWPVAVWKRVNYLLANSAYGTQRFTFVTTKGVFYAFCIIAVLLLIAVGCVSAVVFGSLAGLLSSSGAADPRVALTVFLKSGGFLVVAGAGALFLVVAAYFQKSLLNASFGGVVIGPHRLVSRLRTGPLAWIFITNLLAMVCTLGLFYPWAKVRQARYQLANMALLTEGDLDRFTAAAGVGVDAIGEEIGDFFDIDFGL
ncbi:MAG: YjgN family protein [Pseudomonadota bacterium]